MASQIINLSNVDKVDFVQGGVVKEVDVLKLNDTVIWKTLPYVEQDFIFTVERYTTNTYVDSTSYTDDEIIAFDVTTGVGGCTVTYGEITTTIPASATRQVIYGKYKGVDDGTPTSGTMTISGDYTGIKQAKLSTSKSDTSYMKNVTGVTQWFGSQLTSLTYFFLTNAEIDAPNFEHKVNITNLTGLMYGGEGITIPANLIKQCKKVTSFSYCFNGCTGITEIPANLFANNTAVTSFSSCFNGCTGITEIPENLFANNTAVTSFSYCFTNSGITSIPENLFANNTAVTDFRVCFNNCKGITSIPENLFANNTAVTSFFSCFNGCSGITSIPEGLFRYHTAVTDFSSCFSSCSGITEIPANLFSNNITATSFGGCFGGCTGITSIPANLFSNNTQATSLGCFNGCTGITEIPANLFANNTAVTDFSNCFRGCTGITSIPENLFANNTEVTSFSYCFNGCTALTGTTPVNASGLELWQLAGTTGYPETITGTNCFTNCTGLSNYSSIPSDWGGGATE